MTAQRIETSQKKLARRCVRKRRPYNHYDPANDRLVVRMTVEEKSQIDASAAASGETASEYLRRLARLDRGILVGVLESRAGRASDGPQSLRGEGKTRKDDV